MLIISCHAHHFLPYLRRIIELFIWEFPMCVYFHYVNSPCMCIFNMGIPHVCVFSLCEFPMYVYFQYGNSPCVCIFTSQTLGADFNKPCFLAPLSLIMNNTITMGKVEI